jgi:hypothetical protein
MNIAWWHRLSAPARCYQHVGLAERRHPAPPAQRDPSPPGPVSGWVAPAEDGWVCAVSAAEQGAVATGRRSLIGAGEHLARQPGSIVTAFQVVRDRQFLIAGRAAGAEIGRYVSDPSYGVDDDDLPSDPIGAEHAAAFAAAGGQEQNAELAEVLAQEQDPEHEIESERLSAVLRLLALPAWLVASSSLPKDVSGGPRARSHPSWCRSRRREQAAPARQ